MNIRLAIPLLLLACLSAVADPRGAMPLAGTVPREAIEIAQCRVVHNGKAAPVDEPRMLYALGLTATVEAPGRPWSAGRVEAESVEGDTFQYVVAFKQPVTLGSVLTTLGRVGLLKPGAPLPADAADPEQWMTVRGPAVGGPRLITFDQAVATRAVMFTEVRKSGASTLGPVRLYGARLGNAALQAGARAKSEYQAPANLRGALYQAVAPLRGRGSWASAGPNEAGSIPAPPVSDIHPQWFILGWDQPHTLAGLYLQDNFGQFDVDVFTGGTGAPPLAGIEQEWRKLRPDQLQTASQQGRWVRFAEPVTTTGLRLRIQKALTEKGAESRVARLDTLLAFEDLGTAPASAVEMTPPPPPFKIAYDTPQDGLFTLVVNDDKGRRVRNLLAREPRAAGAHQESWDLADEDGKPVPPGVYRWQAITGPELELRYEMSVYPNVTVNHPENSAWLNGPDGPGGWLADHSPPRGGCAADEYLFFGAPCPESGVGFVCCDLTGKKLWGIHSFAAWSAGNSMATDGKTVFVQQPGAGHYGAADEGADRVWAVDIATRKSRSLLVAPATEKRRRGISGMAARDGKVYLAIHAVDNWLDNASGWEPVDLAKCRPAYKEPRKPKVPYEIVPDPRNDFLRLFRLKGNPPGYGHPEGQGLIWLESTRGPGRRQEILLTFTKPVEIGSCVFPVPQGADYRVVLSALKPEAPLPPNPARREQWIHFERQASLAWDVAIAPSGTTTRALLIAFVKGPDDELSDILEAGDAEPTAPGLGLDDLTAPATAAKPASGSGVWYGRLEGMRLLRRRFENRFATATVRVNSGRVDKDGVWVAQRTEPLSESAPAIYMLEWKEPQTLRGLAVKEVDGERTEIDAYTGPAAGPIDLEGRDNWEKVGSFTSHRRMQHPNFAGHNAKARYLDEMVDFRRNVTTRALRLRVVSQFATPTREGSCAKDELGLDLTRCRIFGVAPLAYLGGEVPVDAMAAERLEVVDGASGKIERELPIRQPGELAFAPDGTLYALSAEAVVKVNLDGGPHQPLGLDLRNPGAMACDRQGNLYVFDRAPERQVVRVFNPAGKLLREIGEPGGYQAGAWNVKRLQAISALAVDREGKLWCVSEAYWPKRICCWSAQGEFLREYLGPTAYGGGGVLDPGDKRRLFYGPLEFELDWATGASRLKNLTWTGGGTGKMFMSSAAGEVPIRLNGRTYLVTRGEFARQACGIVYLYETDRLKLVAALGDAASFSPLQNPEITRALGGKPLPNFQFRWSDRNGDGDVQAGECEFSPKTIGHLSEFDRKLNIQAGPVAFLVKEFLPNGAPVYEEKKLPLPASATTVYRLENGGYYRFGSDGPDAGYAADGQLLWSYKNEGAGVGPDRSCGPYTPAQVVCQFGVVGHETAPDGDLGEFFVVNANLGSWNLWTADGLLAGRLFRDLRDGRRISWTMKEHARGLRLDDVTVGQEHFQGWFCRVRETPLLEPGRPRPGNGRDGGVPPPESAGPRGDHGSRYYAVAGHNHASVVEVEGLGKFKRLGGQLTVTAAEVDRTRQWAKDIVKFRAREEAKVLDCFATADASQAGAWETLPAARLEPDSGNPGKEVSFQMCHDAANLYVRYVVRGAGPFKNSGAQWDRLFKTGAAVDLMLGLDPAADPRRRAPVAGDKRLLISIMNGKPGSGERGRTVAVLYDAVVPGTPPEKRWDVVSPTGRTEFDRVAILPEVRVTLDTTSGTGYTLAAAIPLAAIGLDPSAGRRIRFDWGILETDAEGAAVLRRSYWSNRTTSTLADAPTEARLEPDLWGWALFPGSNRETATMAESASLLTPAAGDADKFELEGP